MGGGRSIGSGSFIGRCIAFPTGWTVLTVVIANVLALALALAFAIAITFDNVRASRLVIGLAFALALDLVIAIVHAAGASSDRPGNDYPT